MLYTSNFYSLKGDRYDVSIITNNNSGTTREITLGVPSFTVEQDTSDDNIYKPVKYQGATVNIVTSGESDYMFDLYSGEADGTRVTLSNSGTTIWDGFATPVIYNNGYTEIHEQLQLECVDGLSILQYYKYSASPKQVISFIEILNKIFAKCKVYNHLYVSNNTKLTSSSNTPILNALYISEQNFFDEKEDNETDDDVAWTCKEVLEEICQYLGLVCVGDANDIYMLDLDALKANINTYHKYNIGSTAYTSVTLSQPIQIEESLYMGANNTISLDNVYNKVSIKDEFYTFDSLIPSLYDNLTNITSSADTGVTDNQSLSNEIVGEVVDGSDGKMLVFIDRVWERDEEKFGEYNAIFAKYYKNDNYSFRNLPTNLNYTTSKTLHGAFIAKYSVTKLDKKYSNMELEVAKIKGGEITIDDWLKKNEISNPSFINYVCLFNPHENHLSSGTTYVTTVSNDNVTMFGGDNAYLLIKGTYIYNNCDDDPYPIPDGEMDLSDGRYAMEKGQTYLLAKLQWGNKYWNGSGWATTSTTFKIPYIREDATADERRADATMFKNLGLLNTVTWRMGYDGKGFVINCSGNQLFQGNPQLTIYAPIDPNYYSTSSGDDKGKRYPHTRVFLKDFDIQAFIGDPTFSDANDTDTVFTNVIDNNHVKELDEITFKICTHDGKNPNYSSVAYNDGQELQFLGNTYNQALAVNKKQEEHLINRLCGQYKEPKVRLVLELENNIMPYATLTDRWLNGKKFIVDSQSIDYYDSKTTITLVEKG